MATCILPLATSGSRRADGTVNAGGTVFLTRPGTANTRVTGYQDKDKSAAHTLVGGGYLLDAAGKIAVFVDEPCSVRIEDQDGVQVDSFTYEPNVSAGLVEVIGSGWTGIDPDTGQYAAGERTYLARVLSSIATSLGGVDGKFLAGTGATGRYVKDAINDICISVKSFGAKGDGVADDTTPIQNTINFVAALGGGTVYLPQGTYLTTAVLIVATTGVDIAGAGYLSTTVKPSSTTANGFTFSSGGTNRIEWLRITHSSTSTGSAIFASSGTLIVNFVSVLSKFRYALNSSSPTVIGSSLAANTADALSVGLAVSSGSSFLSASSVSGTAGMTTGSGAFISGCTISASGASSNGLEISGSADVKVSSSSLAGGASGHGVAILAGASGAIMIHQSNQISPDVLDSRGVAAPVGYTFSGSGNFTPLPLQTDSIRAIATAGGITITVNAIAATGVGRAFRLICSNASGGAVTWTFNAQYVLSAAVNPATGNRVNLLLEYNPVDGKTYEISRAATAN